MTKRIAFINFAESITGFLKNTITAPREWLFQDRDGTLADLSDCQFPNAFGRTGQYLTNCALTNPSDGNLILNPNQLRAVPIVISKRRTITEITFNLTGAVAASNARIGLYADDGNGYPGTLVAGTDVGNIATIANGIKSTGVISVALTPGLYWIAINTDAAITVRVWTSPGYYAVNGIADVSTGTVPGNTWLVAQAFGALPAVFTAGGTFSRANELKTGLKI